MPTSSEPTSSELLRRRQGASESSSTAGGGQAVVPPGGGSGKGLSPAVIVLGVVALLGMNYVLTELMDESGLPVLMVTARVPQPRNASAEALYLASASSLVASSIASDTGLLR